MLKQFMCALYFINSLIIYSLLVFNFNFANYCIIVQRRIQKTGGGRGIVNPGLAHPHLSPLLPMEGEGGI